MFSDLDVRLASAGYIARRPELLALRSVLMQPSGMRAVLLFGFPGSGKSALPEALAHALGSLYVFNQFHEWTDSDELYIGVNLRGVVSRKEEEVDKPGALAVAAEASRRATRDKPTILCLDEVDKPPERVDYLLLDFLQTGRVPVRPGVHIQANVNGLVVFMTSNEVRPMSDALLRRVRRVHMEPLPTAVVDRLTARLAGVPQSVATTMNKVARTAAQAESNQHLSLQEMVRLSQEVWTCAESVEDIVLAVSGWAVRTEVGRRAVMTPAYKHAVAPVWGEISAARVQAAKAEGR